MHRWFGSKEDSDRQQSERSQRQARRYIRQNIIASSEEEDFAECNTSLSVSLNLDGNGDEDESVDMNAAEQARLAALAVERA